MSGLSSRIADNIEDYISRNDYRSYFILSDNTRAGIAIVREEQDNTHYLRYFYISPPFRRSGIGINGAMAVFSSRDGQWKVNTIDWNTNATLFWNTVCKRFNTLRLLRRSDNLGPQWEFFV